MRRLVFAFWPLLGSVLAVPAPAFAAKFRAACPEIAACAKTVAELTGQKYFFDPDVKGTLLATANVEVTKENAEELFSLMLYQNGFTRVPLREAGSYTIMRQRDARDGKTVVIEGSAEQPPNIPRTWDLMTLIYRLKSMDIADRIARNMRSFLPATARIIPNELSANVFVTAAGQELINILPLLRESDVKASPELLQRLERRREEERQHARDAAAAAASAPSPKSKD